jgi:electron transfer flavoprotein alpha subunit
MAATVRGREVAAVLGSKLDAGYAPDAVDLRVEGGKLVAVRSVYSNNILADVTFSSPVQVVSVRPRSFPMPEAGAASGEVKAVDAGLSEGDIKEQVVEVKSTDSGEVSLTDASIIVSGGRGVSNDPAKGFELVAQLASVLGAAVGASRAAVDAGYIPYKHQVGQTGKTVKPDLYIAAGISGAIQHLAGMGGSKLIVAINKDAEAPIFEKANYGIVGDLYQVLPALTAEFKKRLGIAARRRSPHRPRDLKTSPKSAPCTKRIVIAPIDKGNGFAQPAFALQQQQHDDRIDRRQRCAQDQWNQIDKEISHASPSICHAP